MSDARIASQESNAPPPGDDAPGPDGAKKLADGAKELADGAQKLTAKFEALLENTPAGVLFVDKQRGPIQANKMAAELLGQKIVPVTESGEYVRTYGLEQDNGAEYPASHLPILRTLATGERAHVDDLYIRRADNSRIRVEVWTAPVSWSGPQGFDAVVALIQEVPPNAAGGHEHAHQRLQDPHISLSRDDKMRSLATLAGGVAHDFNNILVSVLGNASLIQAEMDDDHPWHDAVCAIVQAAERAAAITKQLVAYARGGSFSPRPVSLPEVIRDSLTLCRSAIPKNASIKFHPQPESQRVEVDVTHMQQILLNLTINAAEAMPDGGEILISTHAARGPADTLLTGKPCVCLQVADSGHGIERAVKDRIFEPFFTTREFGRGLGLASVDGMVNRHGGEILVDSRPGAGTEVSIYLPVAGDAVLTTNHLGPKT